MYRMQYPRTKKPRKISDAVFRGKLSAYNFQVFPLTADIADTPGVFILSRRRTDKFGHGHQSAVCIGETNSIAAELKKHKRAKCVKNNEPNVVCILTEENAAARTGVIKDLTAARKFGCIRNVYDSTIKPKSYEPIKLSGRRRSVAPAPVPEVKPAPVKGKPEQKPVAKAALTKAATKPSVKTKPRAAKATKAKPIKPVAVAAPKRKATRPVAASKTKRSKAATAPKRTSIKPVAPAKKYVVKDV